jgi:uncharacterized repeat protein (TIGR01451 family)
VTGGLIADNAILKAPVNSGAGIYALGIQGLTIRGNLITNPKPTALASRADAGIRLDRIDGLQITGNTITGFGGAIGLGDAYFGTPGVVNVTLANNRIYDNLYGIRVRPLVYGTAQYGPLTINANDNWWGANGGPGSTGVRPDASNPVNGVTFLDANDRPISDQGGVTAARWLHLTCSVPGPVRVNVPAPVTGRVLGMPTVESTKSTPPWFIGHGEPLMEASAPGVGVVYGFGEVPDQGPNNAELTGALLATSTGSGRVFVDLDSERAACPVTVTAGPDPIIDKNPDSPTATPGGLIGFRVTAWNRGRVTGRHLGVCDLPPRQLVFVRAGRRLKRIGKRLCLTIPRLRPSARFSFHLTFRVARNAPVGTIINDGELTPGPPNKEAPSKRPPPNSTPPDDPPGETAADNVVIARTRARLLIRATRLLRRPPPPAVTG